MAAPTVAAVSSGNGTANYNVAVPAGTTNGDLLVAIAASDWGTLAGNDVPAAFKTGTGGLTLGTSDYDGGSNAFHIALGARIANSEPANYNFAVGSSADHVAAIIRVTGHDSTPTIAQVAPSTVGSGDTAPSIVPNGSDDLLITIHGAETTSGGARTWTPPAGMTEHVDRQSTTFTFLGVNSLQSPSNPSGTKVATESSGINNGAACSISIKAAAGGGATDLVIQDALHSHTVDNVGMTQVHSISVQDALHASVADSFGVTQNHLIIINDARSTHTSDVLDLTQVHQIAIHDALHSVVSDNLVVNGSINLTIQDSHHQTSADGLTLVQSHNIAIHDATHQVKSDTISLVPPGTGGFMSVSDVQMQKLQTLTGLTGSIADLERAYYGGLSGLSPVHQFSVQDHKRVYWEAQTGLTGRSLADLEKAFYDVQLIAAGSLSDREFTYWTNL